MMKYYKMTSGTQLAYYSVREDGLETCISKCAGIVKAWFTGVYPAERDVTSITEDSKRADSIFVEVTEKEALEETFLLLV